jgi:hypothetical protein
MTKERTTDKSLIHLCMALVGRFVFGQNCILGGLKAYYRHHTCSNIISIDISMFLSDYVVSSISPLIRV